MNAAIVTFHRAYNFGAKLQQYALYSTTERMGHTPYVLDVIDEISNSLYYPKLKDFVNFNQNLERYCRTAARNLVEFSLMPFFQDVFQEFNKRRFRIGAMPGERGAPEYSALICGSDQVWNPQLTAGDPRYFLQFDSPATRLRIAYAPSFGASDQVPDSFLPELARLLSNIDVLSCREQEGCDLVERLVSRPCPRIVDPVMLLSENEWSKLAEAPRRKVPKKFVFCFDMQHTPLLHAVAQALARRLGASVYSLEGHLGKKGWRSPIGPAEFVWLIQNSSAVVTNSFHGTALSTIFRKPLKVVYPVGRVTRIREFLEHLDLTHLLVTQPEDSNTPATWDVGHTSRLIEAERARGTKFLHDALTRSP